MPGTMVNVDLISAELKNHRKFYRMFPRVYAEVSKKQDESASECLYKKEILNLLVKLLKLKLINKESVYLLTLYYIFIGEDISDLKKI